MKNENENIKICDKCGEKIDITCDSYYYDENYDIYVCDDCFDDYYIRCEDCGEVVEKEDATYIDDDDKWVCQDCLENNYFLCEHCNEYYSRDSMNYVEHYGEVCDSCIGNGDFARCEDCGDMYHIDDMTWSDDEDCWYCRNCEDNHCVGEIYGYHDFDDWQLYNGKDEENAPYYIGKEIEIDPKRYEYNKNLKDVLRAMNRYINAVGMHDGSLSSSGVEIVTHPESWKYLQEKKEDYKKFFDEIVRLGYGDDGNCGLHFHVTRPNDDVVSKIIVILESFKDEIKKLSRRNGNFSWSHFLTDNVNKTQKMKYQSIKYLKEKYTKEYHDRYMALNLCNSKTIEFRFFNGANNFEEFWGALQFIHNIMEVALDDTRDVNTINWSDLLVGDELTEQAKKQGVYGIDKFAKDTTDLLDKIEKAKEEMNKDIRKTLKNFIKYISKELEEKRLTIINKNDIYAIERNGQEFLNNLSNDLNYLHRLTCLYNDIEEIDVDSTKYNINTIKNYTRNMDKYSRYFKQMDNSIKKYESEVSE